MRLTMLLVAASLLAFVPATAADHDGESPLSCDGRLVTGLREPCADYCIHGVGAHYRVSTNDPTNVFPGGCWAS